jgi:hypothetical protein
LQQDARRVVSALGRAANDLYLAIARQLGEPVLFFGEIEMASQLVRTLIANCARNIGSLATKRLDSFGMTPDTWYGSPQFA